MTPSSTKSPEQIIALVREAGVVGAAGVGFPTYLKLEHKVDLVIVNGSECEPLLFSDKAILKSKAEDIIEGLKLVMIAAGAKEGILALNCDDTDGVSAIRKVLPANPSIRLQLLENYYPAGDELLTVYELTKKIIPEGGTPLSVGVCVLNVLTVFQIFQAVNGKPVTERVVTITGEVREPKVVTVPNGTSYDELIRLAGGAKIQDYAVLDGGPMMGTLVSDLSAGIGKSTKAVLLLPPNHLVVRMKQKTLSEVVKESRAASGQNAQSTDLCPRHLLGHSISPHQTMVALDYKMSDPSEAVTSAFLCSGCGICEVLGSEASFLSPKLIFSAYRELLLNANVANPHFHAPLTVHSQYENRKIPTFLLQKKLGISDYVKKLSFDGFKESALVKIPIGRSQVAVRVGQNVRRGDIIAQNSNELGDSIDHASIHGQVTEISDHFIEITGQAS